MAKQRLKGQSKLLLPYGIAINCLIKVYNNNNKTEQSNLYLYNNFYEQRNAQGQTVSNKN